MPREVEEEIQHRRQKAKQQYDKTAKELPTLAVGQAIRIQPVKRWERWRKNAVLKKALTWCRQIADKYTDETESIYTKLRKGEQNLARQ